MFPDVKAEQRCALLTGLHDVHERAVLVGRGGDDEFAVAQDEPSPAGAEPGRAGFGEGLFERGETTEIGGDGVRQAPVGSPPAFGARICQKKEWLA